MTNDEDRLVQENTTVLKNMGVSAAEKLRRVSDGYSR